MGDVLFLLRHVHATHVIILLLALPSLLRILQLHLSECRTGMRGMGQKHVMGHVVMCDEWGARTWTCGAWAWMDMDRCMSPRVGNAVCRFGRSARWSMYDDLWRKLAPWHVDAAAAAAAMFVRSVLCRVLV